MKALERRKCYDPDLKRFSMHETQLKWFRLIYYFDRKRKIKSISEFLLSNVACIILFSWKTAVKISFMRILFALWNEKRKLFLGCAEMSNEYGSNIKRKIFCLCLMHTDLPWERIFFMDLFFLWFDADFVMGNTSGYSIKFAQQSSPNFFLRFHLWIGKSLNTMPAINIKVSISPWSLDTSHLNKSA